MEPENEVSNNKMYAICDIALGLILQRSSSFEMKDYPSEPRIPPMYFKRHEDVYFSNTRSYLPHDMQYAPPKKAGVTVSVVSENAAKRRKAKKDSAFYDEHGNVCIDAQPTDANDTCLEIPGIRSRESDDDDDDAPPVRQRQLRSTVTPAPKVNVVPEKVQSTPVEEEEEEEEEAEAEEEEEEEQSETVVVDLDGSGIQLELLRNELLPSEDPIGGQNDIQIEDCGPPVLIPQTTIQTVEVSQPLRNLRTRARVSPKAQTTEVTPTVTRTSRVQDTDQGSESSAKSDSPESPKRKRARKDQEEKPDVSADSIERQVQVPDGRAPPVTATTVRALRSRQPPTTQPISPAKEGATTRRKRN